MKSFSILFIIFLTLVDIESAANNSLSIKNNDSMRYTKNSLSTNTRIYNFDASIVGEPSSSAAFRDKRDTNFALDPSEIARQNQITEQILSNYLQRRLFPHRSVNQKIPTIAEILPKPKIPTARPRPRGFAGSTGFVKRGAVKQQQRKAYGNGHKNRNSLLQRTRQKPTERPSFEDDYEEMETEKNTESKGSRKRENSSNSDNINDDFVDEAVVEDVEEEPTEEEESEVQQQEQRNYQRHLRRQQQLYRHHYRYLEGIDDPEPDVQESLQSVESEQYDNYYSSNGSRGDVFSRDPSENEIDSVRKNNLEKNEFSKTATPNNSNNIHSYLPEVQSWQI